jgi:hypothetical protein
VVFPLGQPELCQALPGYTELCLASLVTIKRVTSATVENDLFFRMSDPGLIGESLVYSQFLNQFLKLVLEKFLASSPRETVAEGGLNM